MNRTTSHHIIETLTPEAICAALDVSPHSVRYAKTAGTFSASWYDVISRMCEEVGIPCPRSAFNWKAAAKKHGDAASVVQGTTQ